MRAGRGHANGSAHATTYGHSHGHSNAGNHADAGTHSHCYSRPDADATAAAAGAHQVHRLLARPVTCPKGVARGTICRRMDFAWQSTAAPGTWFKIYVTTTGGEGPTTCSQVQATATMKVQTKPDAKNAAIYTNGEIATGGGSTCYWLTAVNAAGESAQVPVLGQT